MGNRGGCLHNDRQELTGRRWVSERWIICLLSFKDRKRPLMAPGKYTELFFLDEATAFAAGHRPCFECQRSRAVAFSETLERCGLVTNGPKAPQLDALIARHVQQRLKGELLPDRVPVASMPNGTMFMTDGAACLKWRDRALLWSFDGYKAAPNMPETGTLLTPPAVMWAFDEGFVPRVHESAERTD